MPILRILLLLSALAIIVSAGVYLVSNNRRYLNIAWQIARFVLFALLTFALLYILERYALVGWRILI